MHQYVNQARHYVTNVKVHNTMEDRNNNLKKKRRGLSH
jgi:hypothetical protein